VKSLHRILASTLNTLTSKLEAKSKNFRPAISSITVDTFTLSVILLAMALPRAEAASSCALSNGPIQHVIYLQFDNTHFRRDNPNVPSDLEQMPHLLNFIKNGGTLLANHHTPLISHTADDIVTSLTGVYPDRHGIPISNSYDFFKADGTTGFTSAFLYWNDLIPDPANAFNMLAANGKNAPAPWVPFTRAGCDVGAVGTANIELENPIPDVPQVFGANSPEAQEANNNSDQATADFIGIAIHCGKGGGACTGANRAVADVLNDEPGGYNGFLALFGHKYVVPTIAANGVKDFNGNPISGFPGFDGMLPAVSLAYVAAMQESGVPVTYAYLSDAHEDHGTGNPFGPGEAGYVAQLKAYDQAFADFFARLANHGIDQTNTLFIITADEGDHFAGGPPSPSNCDGVTIPCTYSQIGEIDINLKQLLKDEQGITTKWGSDFDMAPGILVNGDPAQSDPTVRALERATGKLTATNPITQKTDNLTVFLADRVELKTLHMITADKFRTPTFVLFGNPDYFFLPFFGTPAVTLNSSFAWNHGGTQPEIVTTWLGLVGPGVKADGVDSHLWSDHTDIRPTLLLLTGLRDDYSHDGRVLLEHLQSQVLSDEFREVRGNFKKLADAYKQINAPVGRFGLDSLKVSTRALKSDDPSDETYQSLESEIAGLTQVRSIISKEIIGLLEGAAFHGREISDDDTGRLTREARKLLEQMHELAE
jgi:hypothetical protein